ncbi:hypothetical protein ABB07_37725 [Streptomyces incarnatus]|uniref:Uncharacterized protein n=1 Tax=Streptomyces incarnatus TaxID=665007 RepID=A0ABN4GY16_9ACTN|nr:hypothetical protein [Streptomyces incarnatus]AKJ15601.1 hypothetical protein ABB07_37725 [Streptomyces incarnatus]
MRRIGSTPAERGSVGANNCPDVLELDDGDFLVIGKSHLLTAPEAERMNELGASIGEGESLVLVPRDCILAAAEQLASEGVAGAG